MLKYLGHEVSGHKGLGSKPILGKIDHNYYPYIATFFSREELKVIREEQKYDEPFVTVLLNEYFIENTSRYDSYLQRVERIEIQKSYERLLETMVWADIIPLLDLVYLNYTIQGDNDDIENQFSELFFRYKKTYIDFANIQISIFKRLQEFSNVCIGILISWSLGGTLLCRGLLIPLVTKTLKTSGISQQRDSYHF